jgi:2,3-bisphosphoglycerate-independent phosphoglycerate mutase
MDLETLQELKKSAKSKVILLVMDGLGGLPEKEDGLTELETAKTPNLDNLASRSLCGLHQPIAPGITPGSGPGHLSLFGYDPQKYSVGRGVLSAHGIDFEITPKDVAARGNFCSIDNNGEITDRRAGRISTEKNEELCKLLNEIKLSKGEIFVQTVKEHRFLFVLRGEGLCGSIHDTDPQTVGEKPLPPKPMKADAQETAKLVEEFINKAEEKLKDHHPANGMVLRGFSMIPDWPTFNDTYGVRAAAVADYPMYRGVAKLVGMEALKTGGSMQEKLGVVEDHWDDFDFFFVHIKPTDSSGEDGDFERRVKEIEKIDAGIPELEELKPDVILITGDHSTPAVMASHSWHPVPTLLWSKYCRPDNVKQFGERACLAGGLGVRFPGWELMPLAMANAQRIEKFGA